MCFLYFYLFATRSVLCNMQCKNCQYSYFFLMTRGNTMLIYVVHHYFRCIYAYVFLLFICHQYLWAYVHWIASLKTYQYQHSRELLPWLTNTYFCRIWVKSSKAMWWTCAWILKGVRGLLGRSATSSEKGPGAQEAPEGQAERGPLRNLGNTTRNPSTSCLCSQCLH